MTSLADNLKKCNKGRSSAKMLHRALQVAFKRDKVSRNVVAHVDRPIATKKQRIILRTEDEVRRFREAVKSSRGVAHST